MRRAAFTVCVGSSVLSSPARFVQVLPPSEAPRTMDIQELVSQLKASLPASGYSTATLRVADAALELLVEEGRKHPAPKKAAAKAAPCCEATAPQRTPTAVAETRVAIVGCASAVHLCPACSPLAAARVPPAACPRMPEHARACQRAAPLQPSALLSPTLVLTVPCARASPESGCAATRASCPAARTSTRRGT